MQKIQRYFPVATLLFLGWFIPVSCSHNNEASNPYGLDVVSNRERYHRMLTENPNKELIDLENAIPGLERDIRYATTHNFTGQQIYGSPRAFARKPIAEALKKIQSDLNDRGLGLKVFDAYRPYTATVKFYEVYPDTNFVAAPWHGSRHNRGCAVDVTLIDMETRKELEMPTPFDDFSEKAASGYMQLPDTIIANRQILIDVMTKHGFTTYPYEWWHFDFTGWEDFELMDLSFEELDRTHN